MNKTKLALSLVCFCILFFYPVYRDKTKPKICDLGFAVIWSIAVYLI